LKKRESIVKNFEAFLEESNMEPLATLITNLQDLEIGLCNFFQSLHVKDQSNNVKKLPSLATAQAMRSHLKSMILQLSEGAIDISNVGKFPKFSRVYNSLKRKISSGEDPEPEIEYQDPLISDMQLAYQTEQIEETLCLSVVLHHATPCYTIIRHYTPYIAHFSTTHHTTLRHCSIP
jgi:hypothetical protein